MNDLPKWVNYAKKYFPKKLVLDHELSKLNGFMEAISAEVLRVKLNLMNQTNSPEVEVNYVHQEEQRIKNLSERAQAKTRKTVLKAIRICTEGCDQIFKKLNMKLKVPTENKLKKTLSIIQETLALTKSSLQETECYKELQQLQSLEKIAEFAYSKTREVLEEVQSTQKVTNN